MKDDKKKVRMVLNVKEMPESVYNILNEKALRRNLTPYIVELVKKDLSNKLILKKLDLILSKLNHTEITDNKIKIDKTLSKEFIKEGSVISDIKDIRGEISTDDLEDEQDY